MSSSTVVGTLNNPSTQITIGSINTNLGQLKSALLSKAKTISTFNNRYSTAYRALNTINNASEVPQIFTANKINVARDGSGKIILSPTPTSKGGKKSKKTKNKRKIRKQKGGFEYSGKSKRRRFSVTRSSSPRSSQRSSSQRSSYETQSMVPPKYRARGTKKSKM
jgi:hypothetical protein